jgi:hypothetical protein
MIDAGSVTQARKRRTGLTARTGARRALIGVPSVRAAGTRFGKIPNFI